LIPAAFFQVGCSGEKGDIGDSTVDANGEPVSSVPWNKPESWESTGQLGGLSGGSGDASVNH
jgi:hypothetical protein